MRFRNSGMSILIMFVSTLTAFAQTINPWTSLGPFGKVPVKGSTTQFRGNGLINCVEVHPTDTNTIYIGAEGGLWVSSNFNNISQDGRGNKWVPLAATSELPGSKTICIGNVLVDKTDPSTLFVSTGVKGFSRLTWFYMPSQYTSGIYRFNTDGGITKGTWTAMNSGLPNLDQYDAKGYFKGYLIHTIKQDPLNSNILYAGTSKGLYKTTNAKAASPVWTQVTSVPSVSIKSIAFTNVNLVNSTCTYYVSGDGVLLTGNSLGTLTSLLGTCANCIDVTSSYYVSNAGNAAITYYTFYLSSSQKYPNKVYISSITSSSARSQRYIFSHNGTVLQNLTQLSNRAPGAWGTTGAEPVIASVYNPALSPNEYITLGYEYIEGIYENGSAYTYFSNTNGYSTEYCKDSHADIRDLKVSSNSRFIYCANDGFLSRFNIFAPPSLLTGGSTPTPWEKIDNNGLAVSRILHLSVAKDNQTVYAGLMDDGVDFYNPTKGWQSMDGGDGLDQLAHGGFEISATNYTSPQIYSIQQPQNPTFSGSITTSGTGSTWYYKSLYRDPKDSTVFYMVGGSGVMKYKMANGAVASNTVIANFGDSQHFWIWDDASAFAVSPFNTSIMYIAFSTTYDRNPPSNNFLYVTKSGGNPYYDWKSITLPLANANDRLHGIATSYTDANTLFIAYGNAASGRPRVYKTFDGGATWSDYNNSQGTIPSRCQIHSIVYEKGSNDAVYVGTDNGVYFTNRDQTGWIAYNNGLPAIPVTEMEFNVARNNLTAATFGRGIWQANTFCPVANNTTITNANLYHPTSFGTGSHRANGDMTYQANISTTGVVLKATHSILFQAGAAYTAAGNKQLDAYIAPCTGNSSSLYREDNSVSSYESTAKVIPTEPELENPLKVFPNPNDGEFKLSLEMKEGETATAYIYDMKGNIIYTKELHPSTVSEVDIRGSAEGVYLLKVVKNKKEVYTDKIVIGSMESEEDNDAPSATKEHKNEKEKNRK